MYNVGEIEYLPVADNSTDVVISNCVINLSPYKQQVYNEIFRILRPGGRIAICDVIMKVTNPNNTKEADSSSQSQNQNQSQNQIHDLYMNSESRNLPSNLQTNIALAC